MIFALILLVLLVLSVVLNFSQLVSRFTPMKGGYSRTAGPRLEEATLEDNDASDKIAVLRIDGIITSGAIDQSGYSMVDVVKAQLKRAREDDKVKAVILKVDSPGGEVLAADEIYRAIGDFQKKSGKPVIASMGDLAASGGYYVSAPCRWIVANEMTITGSIGVIMDTWNYRGLMDKIGLRPVVYKSGKFKDMLSGSRSTNEIPAEEHRMVQALIDQVYGRFTNVVAEARTAAHEKNKDKGQELVPNWPEYADGRVLSGTEALKYGFVDQLGDFKTAVDTAKRVAGISEANLIEYQQRYDFSDLFHLFGKSEAPVVKVDLGIDAPKLETGRLYFLSPALVD